ncbi:hypothetical protein XENTR_v10014074 [Xenopus tropicalis]|nr:hypothetical protein XENTR_v10014074 [Xenopus tropicalis]
MKTFWWICFFMLILSLIYGRTNANDDDDDDDDGYDEATVKDVSNARTVQTTTTDDDAYGDNSNVNMQQSETEDPEQARAKLESSPTDRTELGIIKELLRKMDKGNERNLIIICSVMGSGLFLIIVCLICLVAHIAELDEEHTKIIKAEEGRVQTKKAPPS